MHRFTVLILAAAGMFLMQVPGDAATPMARVSVRRCGSAGAVTAAKNDDVAGLIEILWALAKSIFNPRFRCRPHPDVPC
jgi:hypothetical protein